MTNFLIMLNLSVKFGDIHFGGYNINVLRQTACMVVNPITLTALLTSLIARR